jgi:excisionase family DNA binding protein
MTMNESTENIYRFVTVKEACELLSMGRTHVRELIDSGELPSWHPGRQTLRIPWWVVIHRVSQANGIELPVSLSEGTIRQLERLVHSQGDSNGFDPQASTQER